MAQSRLFYGARLSDAKLMPGDGIMYYDRGGRLKLRVGEISLSRRKINVIKVPCSPPELCYIRGIAELEAEPGATICE